MGIINILKLTCPSESRPSTFKNSFDFKFFHTLSSNVEQRIVLTGDHWVRDVHCKKCQNKLGWMYEFATEDTQRYKEARTILEKALVMEKDGIEDHVPMDP